MKYVFLFVTLLGANAAQAEIVRFFQVTPNLYRGGQPETYEDYRFLKKLKIKTIINLIPGGEGEQQVAKLHGMDWVGFPFLAYKTPPEALIDGILETINDPARQPVFLHCFHGKDRTGLVIALHRVLYQKWKLNDAYYEMRGFGFNRIYLPLLYTLYKRTIGIPPSYSPQITPVPKSYSLNLLGAPAVAGN